MKRIYGVISSKEYCRLWDYFSTHSPKKFMLARYDLEKTIVDDLYDPIVLFLIKKSEPYKSKKL